MNPRDQEYLANRIQRLMNQDTRDWMPGDDLEFSNQLPNSRVQDPRRKLPTLERVRTAEDFSMQEYQDASQRCLRMESLINRNKPTSTARMFHDMQRGRMPGSR